MAFLLLLPSLEKEVADLWSIEFFPFNKITGDPETDNMRKVQSIYDALIAV